MSNRRKDRPVPKGFTRYTGTYEKKFYTVLTFNGVVYRRVWPNAGLFGVGPDKYLGINEVFAIKPEYDYRAPSS